MVLCSFVVKSTHFNKYIYAKYCGFTHRKLVAMTHSHDTIYYIFQLKMCAVKGPLAHVPLNYLSINESGLETFSCDICRPPLLSSDC